MLELVSVAQHRQKKNIWDLIDCMVPTQTKIKPCNSTVKFKV